MMHRKSFIQPFLGLLVVLILVPKGIPAAQEEEEHGPPTLAVGAAAPDFCLNGVDGHTHCLKDYSSANVLMVAFICNHCPTSQLYETRIKQIAEDYKDRGVAVVAIEPNNPNAVRLDEMGYTDVGDSFEEMQIRGEYRHFNFPYLYDGEDQKTSNLYGPTATPHVFIFDSARKLRYQGRVDNNPREPLVTRRDARLALDALLAGKPVEIAKTPAVGCSTKWLYKEEGRRDEMAEIEKKPVTVKPVSVDDLRALRKNTTGKLLLVDFWATWCGPCRKELPAFETMYRMYGHRAFDLVTVSINYPDEKPGVEKVLQAEHATSTNLILGSTDLYAQLAAFDPDWNAAVPYTLLIRPDGTIAYKVQSTNVDPLKLKRLIIANLADDDYIGHQAYWKAAVEETSLLPAVTSGAVQPIGLFTWTDRGKYSPGDSMKLSASLQNTGDVLVYVDRRMFWTGFGGGLKLEIKDEQGRSLPAGVLSDAIMPPPEAGDTSILVPLEEGFFYGTSVNLLVKDFFPQPGRYSIQVIYKSWLRKELVAPQLRNLPALWADTPEIASAPIWIEVSG